jgi:hypothetical protein
MLLSTVFMGIRHLKRIWWYQKPGKVFIHFFLERVCKNNCFIVPPLQRGHLDLPLFVRSARRAFVLILCLETLQEC